MLMSEINKMNYFMERTRDNFWKAHCNKMMRKRRTVTTVFNRKFQEERVVYD